MIMTQFLLGYSTPTIPTILTPTIPTLPTPITPSHPNQTLIWTEDLFDVYKVKIAPMTIMVTTVNQTCVDAGMVPQCPGSKGCIANSGPYLQFGGQTGRFWDPPCADTALSAENQCTVRHSKLPKKLPEGQDFYVGFLEGVISTVPDPLLVDLSWSTMLIFFV